MASWCFPGYRNRSLSFLRLFFPDFNKEVITKNETKRILEAFVQQYVQICTAVIYRSRSRNFEDGGRGNWLGIQVKSLNILNID